MEFNTSKIQRVIFTYPYVKVVALFLVWCSQGLYLEIPGPTMIDIKLLFTASYQDVSRSVSGRGAGGFVGALVGFLVDKHSYSLDLFIAVSEALAAGAILLVPFSPSVDTLWFHYFLLGLCGGVINIAGTRMALNLLPQKTTMILQLLNTGYGVGALLVPVIVNPFLAVLRYPEPGQGQQTTNHDNYTVVTDTRVHYAFIFIGICTAMLSVVFFYFHHSHPTNLGYKCVKTDSKARTWRDLLNPGINTNGHASYWCCIIVILCIYFFNMVGALELFGHFVRSFSVDAFNFTKTQASYINMTFWLGNTLGTFFGAFMSNFMAISKLLALQVIVHAVAISFFNLYATNNPNLLWLFSATEGFTIAPLCAGGVAYGNTFVELTGVSLMLIQFAGSFGDFSFMWIAGHLYDTYGPTSVLYALQFVGVVLCVCVVLFRIAARYRVEKPSNEIIVCHPIN